MEMLWKDLRYALRSLLKSRWLTLTAVLTLALAIGANTTIFTVINAVFLSPLQVAEPAGLMAVYRTFEQTPGAEPVVHGTSYLNFRDLREQITSFSELTAFVGSGFNLAGGGEPEQVPGLYVSGNYFDTMGLEPAHGRFFLPEEDATAGTHPVVVLSSALWQRRFAGDPGVVNRTIRLNGREMTVIGVAPAGFRGTATFPLDLWVPLMMSTALNPAGFSVAMEHRGYRFFNMVGRLAATAGEGQAASESAAIAERLAEAHPEWNRNRGFLVRPLAESRIFPTQRGLFVRAGQVLMGAVGLVLLIACANVANLLLARAGSRRKEIGMRVSLGASPGRLIRQLLTESLVLALAGGAAGWLLAIWSRRLLWSLRPPFLAADALDLELNGPVLLFSTVVTLATGLVVGLVPGLQATRTDVVSALKGRAATSRSRYGLRQALVVAQVALSLVLLVGAGLFLYSLRNAFAIDPGFEREQLLVVSFDVGSQGYGLEEGVLFYERLLEEASALPGVESASVAAAGPLSFATSYRVKIEGKEDLVGPEGMYLSLNMVTPGYFETLGLGFLEGRGFDSADRLGGRSVAVINETMARRFWPDESALGRQIAWAGEEHPWEIVGVVPDVKYQTLGEPPQPYAYRPLAQDFTASGTLLLRSEGAPAPLVPAARRVVQELDPDLPIVAAHPVSEVLERSLWAPSMAASLLGAFGVLALVLASLGIYGVLAQVMLARRREMGIRLALGAGRGQIVGLTLRQGMLPVAIGVVLGTVAAYFSARLLGGLLYGLSGADSKLLAMTAAVLAAVAVLACLGPARSATRVDPLSILRAE